MSVRRILLPALAAVALVLGALVALPGAHAAAGDGSPTDPNIRFVGRWDTSNSAAYVPHWAGAYFETGFTGTTVRLKQRNAIDLYYSIDGRAEVYITNVSGTVNLTPTPLAAGNHTLRVSYRVIAGSYRGDAVFQGLVLDSGATTYARPAPTKLVEFVGDSITLGSTSSRTALTAYGWLVGERLGARHTQIAYGGGCLVAAPDGCNGMSNQFFKMSTASDGPAWDFNRYQADAVVVNIGTNDTSHGVSGATFQSTYITFLRNVRAKYPNAAIIVLRTFIGRYATETRAAVTAVGDPNISFVDTTGWLTSDGLSDSVHPNDAGHRMITDRLAPVVAARLGGTSTPTPAPSTPAPTTPAPVGGCAVTYAITNQWSGGFQADVTIRNNGTAAVNGWTLQWSFANGQTVSQAWNASYTQSGATVRATNAGWNGTIAAGGSAAFGFTGTATATNAKPAAFILNGAACTS
jgi:lysophospholipase L1-like esterase